MLDPMLIHDLANREVDFPDNFRSDVAKIAWFARENNVSLEELRDSLERHVKRDPKNYALKIWLDSTKNALQAEKMLVGNLPVLDTKLTSSGQNPEYAAYIFKSKEFDPEGRYTVRIVQKLRDNENGEMTGVPNAEYWSGTPGSYYASTLLGWDEPRGGQSDKLYIDFGQGWYVEGMNDLRKEIIEKYGDEIKNHDLPLIKKKEEELAIARAAYAKSNNNESFKAKKVFETLKERGE